MNDKVVYRCSRHQKEALQELADEWKCSVAELLRGKAQELITERSDAIPNDIRARARAEAIKEDAAPYQRAMHLPNNLHEETRELLKKRFPPHPEDIRMHYFQPYAETIREVYHEREDEEQTMAARRERLIAQMEHVMKRYNQLHYDTENTNAQTSLEAVVDYAYGIKVEEDDIDEAKKFIKKMVNDGILPDQYRDEAFDALREMNRQEWQDNWKRATGNNPPQGEIGQ